MSLLLQKFHRLTLRVNEFLEALLNKIVILAMALLVVDVLWGVFSRFVLGAQSSWTEELARLLLVWVSLLGACVAFREKKHLGIDVFVNALEGGAQKLSGYVVDIIVIIFAVAIFIFGGNLLVIASIEMKQGMIALPFSKASLYIVLPISGGFIFLFAIEDILRRCVAQFCSDDKR